MRQKKNLFFRYFFVWLFLTVFFFSVGYTLLALYQQKDFLDAKHIKQSKRKIVHTPIRGKLLSRDGQVLALSQPYWSLAANPKKVLADELAFSKAQSLLGKDYPLSKKLSEHKDKQFIWLSRNLFPVGDDEFFGRDLPSSLSGHVEYKRDFLVDDGLKPLLGKTDIDGRGLEGLEKFFDQKLKGVGGFENAVVSPSGYAVDVIDKNDTIDPEDIQLTIDACFQYHLSEGLKTALRKHDADRVGGVIIDVGSGEVLALSHHYAEHVDQTPWLLTDLFEPGSVFKPIVMSYLLEQNKDWLISDVSVDTQEGVLELGHDRVVDVKKSRRLNLTDIIKYSSNVGMSKLLLANKNGFIAWLKEHWGILKKVDLPFPSQPQASMIQKPNDFELATLSFGYGINMSIMQLAQAYTTIASKGLFKPLRLLKNHDAGQEEPKRLFSNDVGEKLIAMLHQATQGDATGRRAHVEGMKVAGKTGTTHKWHAKKGYDKEKYVAQFAGFWPVKNPRYVAVVVVDHPKKNGFYGGQVASPIFSQLVFSLSCMCGHLAS